MRPAWPSACRLLVIRLDASGDLLMCTPALHALRDAGHQVCLLTSPAGALVGSRSAAVSQVMIFDSPWMKASATVTHRATLDLAEALRHMSFDGAVIMHSYSQSPLPAAMLCHLAGIPRQLAYCRENPYQLITDWLPEPEPQALCRHEVQRQLDLVSALCEPPVDLSLRVTVTEDDHGAADAALAQLGLIKTCGRAADFILVHPGASAESRRYPLALLQTVIQQLGDTTGLPVVLTGGIQDQSALSALHAAAGPSSAGIVRDLAFGGLAALIGKARLLIANNSAPAHLAAAMQTPVVALYALTNPQHTPWQVPSKVMFNPVPCAPCYRSVCPMAHHACLAGVPPSEVTAAVIRLLAETETMQTRMQQSRRDGTAADTAAVSACPQVGESH